MPPTHPCLLFSSPSFRKGSKPHHFTSVLRRHFPYENNYIHAIIPVVILSCRVQTFGCSRDLARQLIFTPRYITFSLVMSELTGPDSALVRGTEMSGNWSFPYWPWIKSFGFNPRLFLYQGYPCRVSLEENIVSKVSAKSTTFAALSLAHPPPPTLLNSGLWLVLCLIYPDFYATLIIAVS